MRAARRGAAQKPQRACVHEHERVRVRVRVRVNRPSELAFSLLLPEVSTLFATGTSRTMKIAAFLFLLTHTAAFSATPGVDPGTLAAELAALAYKDCALYMHFLHTAIAS